MNSKPIIFLKPGDIINIDGVEMTYEDIMESKIDSMMFRKHLKTLIEKQEVKA